ncbi:MAG: TolB family protein [Hyphomicrobiales bacterium]
MIRDAARKRGRRDGDRRRRGRWPARLAAAALAVALAGCGTKQVVAPVDTNAVVWTRISDPNTLPGPISPDWRGDTLVVQFYNPVTGSDRIAKLADDGTGISYYPGAFGLDFVSDDRPKWESDSILVFSTGYLSGFDLWSRSLATGVVHQITHFTGGEFDPDPIPGTPGVVYTTGPTRFTGRISIIPDTAGVPLDVRYLTPAGMNAGEPIWSPTGSRICFSADSADGSRHVWLATLSAGDTTLTQLTTGPFHDFSPRWMPDGTRILFESDRTGRAGIWWVSPQGEGSGLDVIAFEDKGATIRTPVPSPDGSKIVCVSDGRGFGVCLWVLTNFHF